MFITDRLTVGQITFIIRVAIQVITYSGLFLITLLILATSPRVSPLKTHDVVNRILGKSTATKTSASWIFYSLRGRNVGSAISTGLLFAVSLSLLFGVFASISDIGFLGFYSCNGRRSSTTDQPASVTSMDLAVASINRAMINGTDLSQVTAYRCDAAEVIQPNANITLSSCLSWKNGTFNDPSYFSGLNMTDSEILLPRLFRRMLYKRKEIISPNIFSVGPSNKRIEEAAISEGVVVVPHEMGLRVLFGSPDLKPYSKVALEQVMALEVEMGCMTVGIYSEQSEDNEIVTDNYATNSSWRQYHGPDALYDALSKTVDDVRAFYLPLFNTSSLNSNGLMKGINTSKEILGNCTEAIRSKLNIPGPNDAEKKSSESERNSCNVLGVTGSIAADNGVLYNYLSRMVCATTSQLNLASATVETDDQGRVKVSSLTRHPSDLHSVYASFYDPVRSNTSDLTVWNFFEPAERYTLSPNPASPSFHYIYQREAPPNTRTTGVGSGGYVLSRIGTSMLDPGGLYEGGIYTGVTMLNAGQKPIVFDNVTNMATEWGGQIGASVAISSLALNGYAALNGPSLTVESTGGTDAVCYKPPYAIGFLPLLLAALIVIGWAVALFAKPSNLRFVKQLEGLYAGMAPYWGVVCPGVSAQGAILAWENSIPGGPRLDFVGPGSESQARSKTAMEFLSSGDVSLHVQTASVDSKI
ncbi:hypothetical protein V5O48_003197 [Marasmius crinis-equi]|uniref:Uncharacterized protein n=1 Tax=Marasmius crinis-equi TaxID=585013 RepID=A0ABR3FTX9_9AGAR